MKTFQYMRICLLTLFLLFGTLLKAQDIQDIDVLHYHFVLSLDDNNDSIIGSTYIKFVMKSDVKTATFDLANANSGGKGMHVTAVTDESRDAVPLSFMHTADKVLVKLPQAKRNDTCNIAISYTGVPADGLIISKNKFGEPTFFADNWPNRAHHWIPCNDRPDDKASFAFTVSAPSQYRVISNGLKKDEENRGTRTISTWHETTPLPTKVMVIGAARFAVKTYADSPENLPISAWVYPQDSTKGFYDYALAPQIVKFLAGYIAPFPFTKLANVQSTTIFGGMENASCIFYAENAVTGDRSSESTVVHEIAHQWFGDAASEKNFAHLWLSEGFATYLTHVYFEQTSGKDVLRKRLREDRETVIQFAKTELRPVVDSTENLMSLLNANSYQKGGWVLHMLRNEVSDSTFQKIIQAYYKQFKGGNAETRDFQAIAEKISGKDLKWFFDQWLYQPGISKVEAKWRQADGKLQVYMRRSGAIGQKLPLWIQTRYADGTKANHRIDLLPGEKTMTFSYAEKNKAVAVLLDPDTTLLFEGSISKEKSR